MKVPHGQRRAWVQSTCGGDAALAARVRDALPTEPGDVPTPSPLLKPLESVPESARHIGPFALRGILGEGTFGVVYLADQSDPIPRRVALKVLKPRAGGAGGGSEVVDRFKRERRLLARLDHPGIAHVLDAGVTNDGRPWFALEYVRGLPLLLHCDEARLPVESRVRLFEEICRAVHHAHQNGVLHRDLKPGNVLVSTGQPGDGTPAWGLPKVIDFGIAEALGGDGVASSGEALDDHAAGGARGVTGTLEYMSPEQATGLDLDPRSDVYSLGAILHHLLTGQPPIPRRHVRADARDPDAPETATPDPHAAEVLAYVERIRSEDPLPPSAIIAQLDAEQAADVARLRSTTPARLIHALRGDLDWIVERCLAKDRARRYDSAADLAADLRRHLQSYPVEAAPPSALYRLRRFMRRHRRATVAAAISTLSLVIAITAICVSLRVALRARDAEREARQAAENATSEANDALGALVTLITRISLDNAARGVAATPDEILEAAQQELLEPFRERPRAQAQVRIALAKALVSLDHPDDAADEIAAAMALLGTLGPAVDPVMIDALRTSASIDEHLERFDAAAAKLDQAFDLQRASDPDSAVDWTALWLDRARLGVSRGDGVAARRAVAEAAREIRRVEDPAVRRRLESNASFFRAEALLLDGQWKEALAAIEPNLAYNEAMKPGHWWVAESSAVEAAARIGMGQVARGREILSLAAPELQRALPLGSSPRRVIGRLVAAAFQSQGLDEDAARWRAAAAAR